MPADPTPESRSTPAPGRASPAIAWRRVRTLSLRDLLALGLPALLLLAVAFWAASRFIQPAPPDSLTLATGPEEGAYHRHALRYRELLAQKGFTLHLQPTAGSVRNLELLRDEGSPVEVALVQGGLLDPAQAQADALVSLGGLFHEPVWVFHRGAGEANRLTDLRGRRIAIGGEGSGTRALALRLLEANELVPPSVSRPHEAGGASAASAAAARGPRAATVRLREAGGAAAAAALLAGEIDAAILVSAPEAPVIARLLREEGLQLMGFVQADAYTRRFLYLSRVVLPRGAIDLVRDLPARDVALVAPTVQLVARESLHPTLQTLLLQAAAQVHGGSGLFHHAGDFPTARGQEIALSSEARRFYDGGLPFLQRVLPLWLAILVERLWVMLLPIVAVALPLARILPPLYHWRIRRRILRLYAQLRAIEHELRTQWQPARAIEFASRLDALDLEACTRPIPITYADQLYLLRQHIEVARGTLATRQAVDGDAQPVLAGPTAT